MRIETKIKLNKFIPRSYQVPVVRAIEEEGYRRALLCWSRRCLAGDTDILMANGSTKSLKDVAVGDKILSWNGRHFEVDKVKNKWNAGKKETVTLCSQGYLSITCSLNHKFATVSQGSSVVTWREAQDVKSQQVLRYEGFNFNGKDDGDLAEFIGYMTCDGYVVGYQQPKFTNINVNILKRVEFLAKKLFSVKVIWREKGNGYDLGLTNGTKGGGTFKNPVKELFRTDGQDIQKSKSRLLSCVWDWSEDSILRFFAAVISSDGSIYCHRGHTVLRRGELVEFPPSVEITISCGKSKELANDMFWLLYKIGIKPQTKRLEKASNWQVKIARTNDVIKLISRFCIYGKEGRRQEALAIIGSDYKEKALFNRCRRGRVNKKSSGVQELYDIETEKNHNFVANGYIVHNSGKDHIALFIALRQMIKKVCTVFYIFPTAKQARLAIWDGINSDGQRIIEYIPTELIANKNDTEMKIRLENGSVLQFIGSTDVDRVRGTACYVAIFSEFATQDPNAWAVLRPA